MKRWRVTYKDDYFSNISKYMLVLAETPKDVWTYFWNNHSGIIFSIDFINWV